jgi:hypothetical protein
MTLEKGMRIELIDASKHARSGFISRNAGRMRGKRKGDG